jgi:hypothetical protein
MTTIRLTAKVKDTRTLELPEEASVLALQPGEEVAISLERNGTLESSVFPPNEKGLAAMRIIAERQQTRPYSDDTNTMRLLREARSGAMYGYEPTDK